MKICTVLGEPYILILDAQGEDRAELHLGSSGEPTILFTDAQGKTRAGMFVNSSGVPNIWLTDAQGFEMDLGSTSNVNVKTGATEQTSAASIVMYGSDKGHHVIWQAP